MLEAGVPCGVLEGVPAGVTDGVLVVLLGSWLPPIDFFLFSMLPGRNCFSCFLKIKNGENKLGRYKEIISILTQSMPNIINETKRNTFLNPTRAKTGKNTGKTLVDCLSVYVSFGAPSYVSLLHFVN